MPAKITTIIPSQNFELVRDRIGAIIHLELSNQKVLTGNDDLEGVVWVERGMPFDKTELTAINISLATGSYSNKSQGNVSGVYQFFVDVYTNAKTTDAQGGDITATFKLQKLLGVIRAILENPIYKTLDFTTPFIERTYVSDINIRAVGKDDDMNTAMGRMTFTVQCVETTSLLVVNTIAGWDTTVKLGQSDKGYFYQTTISY